MAKARGGASRTPPEYLAGRTRAVPPHEFVLDALARLSPTTRPMFGCMAVYVGETIVLILRERPTAPKDNGVWLATTAQHHESLHQEFPYLRSIGVLGKEVTGWQILPVDAPDFEESALRACALVRAGDPRIGKVPKPKRKAAKAAVPKKRKASSGTAKPRRTRR
jgi:hypothetical protein